MATFASLKAYGEALDKMAKDLEQETKTRVALEMAHKAQSIAQGEANSDIGGSFSGWRRGAPIELVTQVKKIRDGYAVIPTRVSAGPWTVADQGRNQGNAGGFSGPGISKKGTTSRRSRVVFVRCGRSRRNGGTVRRSGFIRLIGRWIGWMTSCRRLLSVRFGGSRPVISMSIDRFVWAYLDAANRGELSLEDTVAAWRFEAAMADLRAVADLMEDDG